MNADQIRFGVEIETTMPTTDATPIGNYHHGLPVAWLPGWKVERDGSIRCKEGRKPAEFVSGILQGQAGLDSIETACDAIKARGGRVNDSCGIHVTVEFNGDAPALARLVNLVANHEVGLYASTGTKRRERGINGRSWCKGHKSYGVENAKARLDIDRYHLLNLTHIAAGRNRVEFRVFSGSLNDHKITAWVQLCLGLVALACEQKRTTPWDYKKAAGTRGPWDRDNAGSGETEVNRLFYRLGWTKGHTKKSYGVISHANRAKDVLRSMARKYDTQA